MELVNQSNTQQDKHRPHYQGSENPPEEHLVLVFVAYFEIAKYEQENEKIIDTQRKFNHIAGSKLHGWNAASPVKEEQRECCGQADP